VSATQDIQENVMRLFAGMFATLVVAAGVAPMLLAPEAAGAQVVVVTPVPHVRHPETPKVEVFLGYSRFGTFSNNTVAGNRMIGLNGGSASIAFNFNRYIGLVGDFGGYDDSQVQLTGTGANQPIVVNSSGTAYTYLFGPRFSFRNDSRFTPFVQVLAGGVHASAVTAANCAGTGCVVLPVQSSFAMTGGGGLDIRITHHVSIRAVQAEYMMTRFDSVPAGGSSSQNDLRLSTGLLFSFGGRMPEPPVGLTCSVQPAMGFAGDPLTVTAMASNLNPKRKVSYSWSASGGVVGGTDATASVNTAGLAPGSYTISGHVTQGTHVDDQASCTASFTIELPAPPTVSCTASPSTVMPGDTATITAQGVSPQNRPLSYSYSATAGAVTGSTASASLSTSGVAPGDITVTCNVVDDLGKTASATTVVTVAAPPVVAAVAPQTSALCAISFDRDRRRPERVDNEAKGCLDDVALQMQRESAGRLVIVGNYSSDEKPKAGAERTLNVRQYLVEEKGIDAGRIDVRVGTASGRTASNVFVPSGATYSDDTTTPVDATMGPGRDAYGKPRR
jgi:opacity protein-like surface antigen